MHAYEEGSFARTQDGVVPLDYLQALAGYRDTHSRGCSLGRWFFRGRRDYRKREWKQGQRCSWTTTLARCRNSYAKVVRRVDLPWFEWSEQDRLNLARERCTCYQIRPGRVAQALGEETPSGIESVTQLAFDTSGTRSFAGSYEGTLGVRALPDPPCGAHCSYYNMSP